MSWRRPVLGPIIARRPVAAVITAILAAQIVGLQWGFVLWSCPLERAIGRPCPGCGLSRSTGAALRGDWARVAELHLFGPVVAIGLGVVFLGAILPNRHREGLVRSMMRIEERTGIVAIVLLGLVIYWLARLVMGGGTIEAVLSASSFNHCSIHT